MNQQRDIVVTQIINELGVTIETNTKPLIHCKDFKYRGIIDYPVCCESTDEWFCADGERKGGDDE